MSIRRIERSEDGSVIMAVIVLMVLSLAAVTMLAVVGRGLNLTKVDQDRVNAFQYANAGVDQALFRIDEGELPTAATGSYNPTVVGGEVQAFTDSVVGADGSRVDIEVFQDPPGQTANWTVKALGTDETGRRRLAVTTIKAPSLFVDGFLTLDYFYANGAVNYPQAYDSALCVDPRTSTAAGCNLGDGTVSLGTNNVIDLASATVADFNAKWAAFNMYGKPNHDTAWDACDNKNCTSDKVIPHANEYEVEVPPIEGTAAPAAGCTWTGVVVLTPGKYVCPDLFVTRGAVVSVNSSTAPVELWVTGDITVEPTAVVNRANYPWLFQVYQSYDDDNPSPGGSICASEVWGLLYTPNLYVDCQGAGNPDKQPPHLYGSIVANLADIQGNAFRFVYDANSVLHAHTGEYAVHSWRECPPSQNDTC